MDKTNYVKMFIATVGAFLSAKLGILFPILSALMGVMIVDYLTGIIASAKEGKLESKIGMWGIVKKLLYMVEVAIAMLADWVIITVASYIGVNVEVGTFFGLLVAIWLIFNELYSIIENLIRMEVPLPNFIVNLTKYFKVAVEKQGDNLVEQLENSIKK
ncbi:MAG: phage holin family protein [Clostridium sp.]